ncbi:MAG TPA: methylated-DNA--[protein]-cysteine S-methyltransferase [Opitutaceae bacterium]
MNIDSIASPLYVSTFDTAFGPFSLAVDDRERVVATAFGAADALMPRFAGRVTAGGEAHGHPAREQLRAWFEGRVRSFDLQLAPEETAFQKTVWMRLRAIPYGTTTSYGTLARELHSSPRAVGRAVVTNPVCVIVFCHRVIGTDGSLTGFAYGEPLKRRLLELESALLLV